MEVFYNVIRRHFPKLTLFLYLISCPQWAQSQQAKVRDVESGPGILHQRILDLSSNLRVMSIALQPGFEDLAAVAFLRLGRGAKIMSVYATNGDAGESDAGSFYPRQLAAERREEAGRAMKYLNAECYFLNLQDVAAAADTGEFRQSWPRDTVQLRLLRVISSYRPDLIVVPADLESTGPSLRWRELLSDILRAVERLAIVPRGRAPKELLPFPRWSVSRVVADDGSGKGIDFQTGDANRTGKKTYKAMGEEAGREYRSSAIQRSLWRSGRRTAYNVVMPRGLEKLQHPDQGIPAEVPARLRTIANGIDQLARQVGRLRVDRLPARTSPAVARLAAMLDSIDIRIARSYELQSRERAILLQWKEGLENLRQTLLGVSVSLSISETVLTDRQLTYVKVDTVTGLSADGKTEIFFPGVGKDWIVNESLDSHLPLKLHEEYRLLVQRAEPYTVPRWEYGLEDNTLGRPLYLFIVHQAPRRAENFVFRKIISMDFAPRFSVEILTPIVRAIPGERLIVRLTNNSRDGVKDEIFVNDSLVSSTRSAFRLNEKGGSHLDTLVLSWDSRLSEGSHLFPISIEEEGVGQFAARKFSVHVDSTRRIGIFLGSVQSPTLDALRRIGIAFSIVRSDNRLQEQLSMLDVLLLDRRVLSTQPNVPGLEPHLDQFVQRGGHLVVLGQDADVWNRSGLISSLKLKRSFDFGPSRAIRFDSSGSWMTYPNRLKKEDWSDWLYRRSYNEIQVLSDDSLEIVLSDSATGKPFAVNRKKGKGETTYLDMDLQHQWLNIHAGAFRLLANVLAH